jgi:hypothetical protein
MTPATRYVYSVLFLLTPRVGRSSDMEEQFKEFTTVISARLDDIVRQQEDFRATLSAATQSQPEADRNGSIRPIFIGENPRLEHPSEEGTVFGVFKRQSVAIFDHMFTPDVYIGKIPSLVLVHYDVIQNILKMAAVWDRVSRSVRNTRDYGCKVLRPISLCRNRQRLAECKRTNSELKLAIYMTNWLTNPTVV